MNDQTASLTRDLKARARDLGFSSVGVAEAQRLIAAEQAIDERVSRGELRNYGFASKPAHSFTAPEAILSGARSIVSIALTYAREDTRPADGVPRGVVARFARGRDYHSVVTSRLSELGRWLTDQTGEASVACVDTGPLIDRAVAREAGVGSYGKNCSIITGEAGSWVVLGELVTAAELAYDSPATMEECGDCRRCIDACPTGAIVRPFAVDQTKCLSHITQMRGVVPQEYRPLLGDRVYGCDTCQEVCPKNWGVQPLDVEEGPLLEPYPDLLWLLNISDAEFQEKIVPTAPGWIGRTRIRRNAAIALGNLESREALPALAAALHDPDPAVRLHAAWALGRLGSSAPDHLRSALETETDSAVRQEIESALDC